MKRRPKTERFDASAPLYMRRSCTFRGVAIAAGARVPDLVPEEKRRQWHRLNRGQHAPPDMGRIVGPSAVIEPVINVPAHEDLLTEQPNGALAHLSDDELDAMTAPAIFEVVGPLPLQLDEADLESLAVSDSPALPSAGASDVVTAGGDADRASHGDVAPSPGPRTDAQAARHRRRRS